MDRNSASRVEIMRFKLCIHLVHRSDSCCSTVLTPQERVVREGTLQVALGSLAAKALENEIQFRILVKSVAFQAPILRS